MDFNTSLQLSESAVRQLMGACPAGEFRVLATSELPAGFPLGYLSKCAFAVVMHATSSESDVLGVNFLRVDTKAGAVDQDVCGIAVPVTGGATAAGQLLHGNWLDRTVFPSVAFFSSTASAASTNYPGSCMPSASSGALSAISTTPHFLALEHVAVCLEHAR